MAVTVDPRSLPSMAPPSASPLADSERLESSIVKMQAVPFPVPLLPYRGCVAEIVGAEVGSKLCDTKGLFGRQAWMHGS
jgi:hypothetical protein